MASSSSILAPFTLKGFYLLTWGTALGTNVWNSAVSGLCSMLDCQEGIKLTIVSPHPIPP